jgi:signal peptidase I
VGPEAQPDDGGPGYAPPRPGQPGTYQDQATEVLRRYVPANEVLDREAMVFPATHTAKPSHPPRAVVRRRRARRRAMEWPFLVAFALVAAFLIRMFGVQTFYIPSGSMHETLLEGDRVLVNKVAYHLHTPHRGDVVVFRKPPKIDIEDDDLIKRVVALPGETVQGQGRKVLVNGKALTEPYVEPACGGTEDFAPVTVPAGHLWVMGDNRCDSSDSRVFGPIDDGLLVGRAFVLVWPTGRIAWL